ncbi:hypothetical protein SAMN05444817_101124 [Corynebacterium appendicis CIP 107643]|uniref:TadE-like protein n=1 Tax=Corynebacterium appendicis CIP 107643 TaxID=1161099 RepID=A0A1N7INW9_9CORY|nr:hypothetical protein [Corynebacterium appendicis]WJY60121.1 hypothetical protein CAPP_00845 [Corynebacterium appendicis CIP 107643]SIS38661.1 hypothetical protein SAMN05444817_101124 [Corynebacterium appendicis CIP 107643]
MSRRIALIDDRGSVTIEASLALAVLVTVAAAIVAGMATLGAYISAVDIAGAAARSHAIGVPYDPPRDGVTVTVTEEAGVVRVTAQVPAPVRAMSATAAFPVEAP